MKIQVVYKIEGKDIYKRCIVTGKRIKTVRDQIMVERAIARKIGENRVKVISWKIIGNFYDKIGK